MKRERARLKRKRRSERRKKERLRKKEVDQEEIEKERKSKLLRERRAVESADKSFACSVKSMIQPPPEYDPRGYPHMEWNGTSFTPTPPSPPPRMDINVSMMHTAHEKFGVKWNGSRKGLYKRHTVTTLADSGCQTCTAGVDFLEEIGCPLTFLIPTRHRIMGITKSSLDVIGSLLLRIEYGG